MLFIVIAAMAASVPSDDFKLDLVCVGTGTQQLEDSSKVEFDDNRGYSADATATKSKIIEFEEQVNVEITGNQGRILFPERMLPVFRGGDKGWIKLKNIAVGANEITATAAINFISRPTIRLDRRTGAIAFAGTSVAYRGQCAAYDPTTVKRAF